MCFKELVGVFASLDSPHGFLSMIFGILGKFWIDIGVQTIFHRKKFRRKKAKLFFENFWPEIFGRENFRPKKLDFEILGFWTFRNFEILKKFNFF